MPRRRTSEDDIVWVEYGPLPSGMDIKFKELAILPCCEQQGVFWGRSASGKEWAECSCGQEWPGYMANEHEQRRMWAEIDKRDKEKDAATAA